MRPMTLNTALALALVLTAGCAATGDRLETTQKRADTRGTSPASEVLCPGERMAVTTGTGASVPYLPLTLDGKAGAWLLDYGHAASRVSKRIWPEPSQPASRFGTNNFGERTLSLTGFSFPGWAGQTIAFVYDDWNHSPPGVGYQNGILGVDLLNNQAVSLHFEDARDQHAVIGKWGASCTTTSFAGKGLRRISQAGYFENTTVVSKGVGNTPVVFIELETGAAAAGGAGGTAAGLATYAQIDTGYDDSVRPGSIDINKPFEDALLKLAPKPKLLASMGVQDCDGVVRQRRVYEVPGRHLRIQDEAGNAILRTDDFVFVAKETQPKACGGITQDAKPAAQLGASFLRLFGTILFLPQAKEVWIRGTE